MPPANASVIGSEVDWVAMPPKPAWMPPLATTVSFFAIVLLTPLTPPADELCELDELVDDVGAAATGAAGAVCVAGAGAVGAAISPTWVGPEPSSSPAKLTGANASMRAITLTARRSSLFELFVIVTTSVVGTDLHFEISRATHAVLNKRLIT
jgi:hypothetical protein